MIWIPFFLTLVGFLAGCETLKSLVGLDFRPPEVELSNVHIRKVSLDKIDVDVELLVNNQNDRPLQVYRVQYQIWMDTDEVATGEYEEFIEVPALTRKPVRLPLTLNLQQVGSLVQKIFDRGRQEKILVKAAGVVVFESPLGKTNYKFKKEKELQLGADS